MKTPKPVTPNRYGAALPAKPMSQAPTKVSHGNNLGKYLHQPKGKR